MLVSLLRRLIDRIFSVLDAPLSYLFGRDIFISYSRADASKYAPGLANAVREQMPDLSFYLDRWIAPPSGNLPGRLKRQLRWSRLLVLVCTERAIGSAFVKEEIKRFAKTNRQIIPVNVDGIWNKLPWDETPWAEIKGAAPDYENKQNVIDGTPSPEIIERIKQSVTFTRQDRRLRNAVRATVIGIASLVLIAIGLSSVIIQRARAEAATRIAAAEAKEQEANSKAAAAELRESVANDKANKAEANASAADVRAKTATDRADSADSRRERAESDLVVAQTKTKDAEVRQAHAEKLQNRATALGQSRTALTVGNPKKAAELAKSGLKIADGQDARLLLAEAYNLGIATELRHFDQIRNIAVDPTGATKVAAIGARSNTKAFGNRLKLWDLTTQKEYQVDGYVFFAVQFAPDGKSLFAVAITEYEHQQGQGLDAKIKQTISLIKYDSSLNVIESRPIKVMASSPTKKGEIEWDIRDIQDIRFDKERNRLLMAGYASPAFQRVISNGFPHHFRAWVNLDDMSMHYNVDVSNELSAFHDYRGRVIRLGATDSLVVDGTSQVYLIDLLKNERTTVGQHPTNVMDLAASPTGNKIAAVGKDNKVSIFSLDKGAWHQSLITLGGEAACDLVTFIDDSKLAIARQNFSITILSLGDDVEEDKLVLDGETTWQGSREINLTGHTSRIRVLKLSPDGKWLATAGEDKALRLWSVLEGNQRIFLGNERGISNVEFSPDSRNVFAAGFDGVLRRYDVSTPYEFTLPVNPAGRRQEVVVSDSQWDEGGGLTIAILREHLGFVRQLGWNREKEYLYARTYDRRTTSWDRNFKLVETNQRERTDKTVESKEFSKTASGAWPEVTKNKQLVMHKAGEPIDEKKITPGYFSPNGNWFVQMAYDEDSIYLWDLKANHTEPLKLTTIYGSFHRDYYGDFDTDRGAKFSPGGNYLAIPFIFDGEAICVIDLKAARATIFKADIVAGAFDISDDAELVAAGRTGEVFLYSVPQNTTTVFEKHSRYVSSVAFSPDGKWIASGSRDRSVRLWSREESKDFVEFRLMNPVEQITFSADGKRLLAASGLGIHAWYVPASNIEELVSPGEIGPVLERNHSQNESRSSKVLLSFLIDRPGIGANEDLEESLRHKIDLSDKHLQELVETLVSTSETPNTRVLAAIELRAFSRRMVKFIPRICQALKETEKSPHLVNAIFDLIKIAGPQAEDGLLETFSSSQDSSLKRALAPFIPALYGASNKSQQALRQALNDPVADVRIVAAINLSEMTKDNSVIPILSEALNKNDDLKLEASETLSSYGLAAVPALISTLDNQTGDYSDSPVDLARKALVKIGRQAVPSLLSALKEKQGEHQERIVRTLGSIGKDANEAIDPLIQILRKADYKRDRDFSTYSAVVQALGEMGPESERALPELIKILLDSEKPQIDASYALNNIGPKAVPLLIAALSTPNAHAKRYIVSSLGRFEGLARDAVPALIDELRNSDFSTAREIVETLGKIGPAAKDAVPEIIKFAQRNQGYEARYAVESLGLIKGQPDLSIPAIFAILAQEGKKGYQKSYALSDGALRRLSDQGLPQNLLLKLTLVKDDWPRIQEYFLRIIERTIGREDLSKYQALILSSAEIKGPHRCDEHGLYREGLNALAQFGEAAQQTIPAIEKLQAEHATCFDINEQADKALKLLRNAQNTTMTN